MKAKIIISLLLSILFNIQILGQNKEEFLQKDWSGLVDFVAAQTDTAHFKACDHHLWEDYLNRPHPNVRTLNTYFEEASDEFGVPADLLKVIAQVESNWTQLGPSIDKGWGIMHLVDNSYANTLNEAAHLLKLEPQILKDDPRENIRGMAALLNRYAKDYAVENLNLASWYPVIKATTGLYSDDLADAQVYRYFETLKLGVESSTLWGEQIKIPGRSLDISEFLNLENSYIFPTKTIQSLDYPPAISNLTPCNYALGRNHEIDAWVNHWIGVGTYVGAISWFHNCDSEVSSHFVIRAFDGEITQVVSVDNTAWHCGATGYPYNNSRSIGVEHEATLNNPEMWNSMPMLEASAQMAAFFCDQYDIPKIKALPGINGHDDMPGTNTMCPGNLPWFTWMSLLDENYVEADLVIMDMWTEPEQPKEGSEVELFVEIKNVGNASAGSILLDYRINGAVIGGDSLISLPVNENHTFSYEHYIFQSSGSYDYCVYIAEVSNESNTMNNSYCVEVTVDPLFSVHEKEAPLNLNVYPNPSSGIIHFKTPGHIIKSIEIYNLKGMLINTYTNTGEINLYPLPKGPYLLKFIDLQGEFELCRVIKQ